MSIVKDKSFPPKMKSIKEETERIIEKVINGQEYESSKVQDWVHEINERTITELQRIDDESKYILSIIILERKNGGFHLFTTVYWDSDTDGTVTARYESNTMHVVVCIFAITID